MRMAMSGFNPYSGIGFVTATPASGTSWLQDLIGDVTRGGLNIVSGIVTPPSYQQGPTGVTIRGGAPVLATGGAVGSGQTGANWTSGNGVVAAGMSTSGMLMLGLGLVAVMIMAQGGRR